MTISPSVYVYMWVQKLRGVGCKPDMAVITVVAVLVAVQTALEKIDKR